MQLSAGVFDVWVFRRLGVETEYLLLYTSVEKATRYFNGGRKRIHYRGLKDGLRSVHEYITGVPEPAKELCLYVAPGG